MDALRAKFTNTLKPYLPDDILGMGTYVRGRVGLYAILKSMGVNSGDEVVIQGFTCVVVPNAVLYLGAKPVYVDVNSHSLNTDLDKIKLAITTRTKVVVVQNTLGLSSQVDEIAEYCTTRGIYTVEDCTHGFGGNFKGKPNGSFCDAAFYSTQWNKPFSTGIGGFAVVRNENIDKNFNKLNAELPKPSVTFDLFLSLLIWFRENIMKGRLYWSLLRLYRFLSRHNLVIGSSSGEELKDIRMPNNYLQSMGRTQIEQGIVAMEGFDNLLKLRKENAIKLTAWLKNSGLYCVRESEFPNHSFLKYPLFVKDREVFFDLAEKSHIALGDWFVSPIHPVTDKLDKWSVEISKLPIAEFLSQHIVNVPLDSHKMIDSIIPFLDRNKELLLNEGDITN